jgi:hypothetical protein
LVSIYAWANVATIAAAAWFAAPYGLIALAWALAGRGVTAVVLFIFAMRQGLERPVAPILRLLLLPSIALAASRLGAWLVLGAHPGLALVPQLLVGTGVSAGIFAALVLIAAPRRIVKMVARLHSALLGKKLVS